MSIQQRLQAVRGSVETTQAATRPDAFREAMSRVAAAVHLVTTDGVAGLGGLCATAMVPVSDDPATLLVCINASSRSAARFLANGVMAVNTLAADQRDLADIFAGKSGLHLDGRFAHGVWRKGITGAPLLERTLTSFDCRIVDHRQVASHLVIVARVEDIRLGPSAESLVYLERAYRTL